MYQAVISDSPNGVYGTCLAARVNGLWELKICLPKWVAKDIESELLETGVFVLGSRAPELVGDISAAGANGEWLELKQAYPLLKETSNEGFA